jgi:hypothetical protein
MFEDAGQSLLNMCLLGCLFFDPHLPRRQSNPQICDRDNKSNNARILWTLKSLPLYCWHRVLFGDVFIRGVVLLHSDNLKLAGITWALCRHVSSRVGVKFVVGALLLSVRTIKCFTIEFPYCFLHKYGNRLLSSFQGPFMELLFLDNCFLARFIVGKYARFLFRYAGVTWLLFVMGCPFFIGL